MIGTWFVISTSACLLPKCWLISTGSIFNSILQNSLPTTGNNVISRHLLQLLNFHFFESLNAYGPVGRKTLYAIFLMNRFNICFISILYLNFYSSPVCLVYSSSLLLFSVLIAFRISSALNACMFEVVLCLLYCIASVGLIFDQVIYLCFCSSHIFQKWHSLIEVISFNIFSCFSVFTNRQRSFWKLFRKIN